MIEWIIDNRDGYVDENRLLDALKEAMRPTTTTDEGADKAQLLDAFNQLEDSND